MRVKKQKRHRRAVRFYTACYGFREPFKILCDGTFVHHLLTNAITPADTALANTLGAPVKLFTTRCALAELRSLGDSYSDSLNAARNLLIARCDHEKRKSAVACMTEVIGENNAEHFFVATQDVELRRKLQEIPGVPLIYGLRNALLIERPSAIQQKSAKTAEEARLHMTELEYKMAKVQKKRLTADEEMDSSDDNQDGKDHDLESKIILKSKEMAMKDKAQFKRKRAKGPNPLSCKKKKNSENTKGDQSKESGSLDNSTRMRSRKRKRSRKSKSTSETSA